MSRVPHGRQKGERMLEYHITIGLAPMRRDVTQRPGIFNWEKAEVRGRRIVDYIETNYRDSHVTFVDLSGINPVDVMYCEEDADAVIERFRDAGVDGIVLINCNFGNEEIAGRIAATLKKPVLVWAPLDDEFEADGTRYTDSQCGIFGVARQLQRLHVPFGYIENCAVEDDTFREGLDRFVRIACMVKNFKGMRIGQVGMRPKPFCSVIYNEGELMSRFGIQVIPINMAVVIDKFNRILETEKEELGRGAQLLQDRYQVDGDSAPNLEKIYAFVLLYRKLFAEYRLDACASECWTSMQLGVGAMPCTAFSILADEGYIIACETDIHAAVSMALLSCAALGEERPFLGEFTVKNPRDTNSELLWHCGPFAYSLKKEGAEAKMVNMRQWFPVKDGTYTLARMDQADGRYSLLTGQCESTEGPYTFGTYLWAKFGNLGSWERKLIEGPYIHHIAEVEGAYEGVLREFCRFIPDLEADWVEE